MSNEQPETRDIETEAQDLDERSVKRPRTADDSIDPNGVPDGDQQDQAVAGVEGGEGEGGGAGAPEPTPQNAEPVKIGYKSFASGAACYEYFHNIISKYRKNQNLNEYEFHNVIELIKLGHPEAERKLSGKVTAIQIRDLFIAGKTSSCFHLIRTEGPVEDVSYRKCIANLFPEMKELVANQSVHQGQQSGSGRGKKNENGRGRGGRRGGRRGKGRV